MKNKIYLLTTLCITLILTTIDVYSACDSTNVFCRPDYSNDSVYVVKHIGHLNFDCYLDTLICSSSKRNADTLKTPNTFFPKYIFWGRCTLPPDSMENCPCYDSLGVPDSQKVWYTRIDYPSLYSLRAVNMFFSYNEEDSVTDIITMFWGKTANDTSAQDTSVIVSLFGQDALDTLISVDLGDIDTIITTPFLALRMWPDIHFSDSARRDFTGKLSFCIPKVSFTNNLSYDNDNQSQMVVSGIYEGKDKDFEIFPNPARDGITVQYRNNKEAEMTVIITQHTGNEVIRIPLPCTYPNKCTENIMFGSIPSGLYSIRILDNNKQLLYSKSIVVLR